MEQKWLQASPDFHQQEVIESLIAACVAAFKARSLGSLIVVTILAPCDIFVRVTCYTIAVSTGCQ
jgi:hypothetical protein